MNKLIVFITLLLFTQFVSATMNVSLWDEGTDVRIIANGKVLNGGFLQLFIYDQSIGGNLIWEGNWTNAINNGSWNVMISNISLEYGKEYWKNYKINYDEIDFNGVDRLSFFSPLGDINETYLVRNINLTNATGYGLGNINGIIALLLNITNLQTSNNSLYTRVDTINGTVANLLTSNTSIWNNLNPLYKNVTSMDNATLARTGYSVCPAGEVMMNVTSNITGIFGNCTAPPAGAEVDPLASPGVTSVNNSFGISNASMTTRVNTLNITIAYINGTSIPNLITSNGSIYTRVDTLNITIAYINGTSIANILTSNGSAYTRTDTLNTTIQNLLTSNTTSNITDMILLNKTNQSRVEIFKDDMNYLITAYNRIGAAPTINTADAGVESSLNFPTTSTINSDGGLVVAGGTDTSLSIVDATRMSRFEVNYKMVASTLRQDILGAFKTATTIKQNSTSITGIFFQRNTTDSANWYAWTCDNNVCQKQSTGVAGDTNFHTFTIVGDANGGGGASTSYGFYIDGVLKVTNNQNLPTTRVSTVGTWVETTTPAVATARVDWIYYENNR